MASYRRYYGVSVTEHEEISQRLTAIPSLNDLFPKLVRKVLFSKEGVDKEIDLLGTFPAGLIVEIVLFLPPSSLSAICETSPAVSSILRSKHVQDLYLQRNYRIVAWPYTCTYFNPDAVKDMKLFECYLFDEKWGLQRNSITHYIYENWYCFGLSYIHCKTYRLLTGPIGSTGTIGPTGS